MFPTPGDRDKNQLPSGTNPAHWAEQQNLVSPLTRRSKTDAWTPNVRWALDLVKIAGDRDRDALLVEYNYVLCVYTRARLELS